MWRGTLHRGSSSHDGSMLRGGPSSVPQARLWFPLDQFEPVDTLFLYRCCNRGSSMWLLPFRWPNAANQMRNSEEVVNAHWHSALIWLSSSAPSAWAPEMSRHRMWNALKSVSRAIVTIWIDGPVKNQMRSHKMHCRSRKRSDPVPVCWSRSC